VSLFDLFNKWTGGATNLEPTRRNWPLRVTHDVLYRGLNPVGVAAHHQAPRLFWYLVTAFAGRLETRTRLEDYGGVPCMGFELKSLLLDRGIQDGHRLLADVEDKEAFDFVGRWVAELGRPSCEGLYWRNCRIQAEGMALDLGRTIRGNPTTNHVAYYKEGVLYLLGQARRNPPLLWVRDAIYIQLGRAKGRGFLPDLEVRKFGTTSVVKSRVEVVKIREVPERVFE
jgi:hypothetical protein